MTPFPDRPQGGPTIVLVNPNTSAATTAMMTELARASLAGALPATVRGITVDRGPAMLVEPRALAAAAGVVVDRVLSLSEPFDAVIVAAAGDPGREELERALRVPVVGIGQAAVLEAAARGRRFAMATTTPALTASLEGLVRRHAPAGDFAGVFLTADGPLALAADPEAQYVQLREAARAAQAAGAETVITAGGPLSGTARRIRETTGLGVVEPVPAAVRLVRQRLAERTAGGRG